MKLYNYFRSSASYRVRIALALKGLDYDYQSIHLVRDEQFAEPFASNSMSRLVPLLELDSPNYLSQSLAIIEYLDETHPEPPLLPADPFERAQVRALAQDIACDIHPLNNTRVLRYLKRDLDQSQETVDRWYRHWIEVGLAVVEQRVSQGAGRFCHGDTPGLADCLLVPQIFNAQRFDCPLQDFPQLMRVFGNCMALDAFAKTQPSACPDAQP